MRSETTYLWHGHTITLLACASAKYLWLDYRMDVRVDGKQNTATSNWNGLRSSTSFKIKHQGKNAYGQVVSSGFPCTPVVTQATIMDDSIIGHCQLKIKHRWLSYSILASALLFIIYL